MRGSGSHDIVLKEVFVPEENLLTRLDPGQSNRFTSDSRIYSLELPAVYLGIAGAARKDSLKFAETTFSKSLGDYVKTAGHVRQKIGEMEILYKNSRSVLYSLAERWERDPSLRNKLPDEVSMAKYLICNNAIKITELAMRIVGGSSLSRNQKLQRLFRDVQCGLYNPPQDDMVIEQLASSALREVSQNDQDGKERQIDQYRGLGGNVNFYQKTTP
jgi:alkylation response protein AidB-like acyl-CoA dehydrogenase